MKNNNSLYDLERTYRNALNRQKHLTSRTRNTKKSNSVIKAVQDKPGGYYNRQFLKKKLKQRQEYPFNPKNHKSSTYVTGSFTNPSRRDQIPRIPFSSGRPKLQHPQSTRFRSKNVRRRKKRIIPTDEDLMEYDFVSSNTEIDSGNPTQFYSNPYTPQNGGHRAKKKPEKLVTMLSGSEYIDYIVQNSQARKDSNLGGYMTQSQAENYLRMQQQRQIDEYQDELFEGDYPENYEGNPSLLRKGKHHYKRAQNVGAYQRLHSQPTKPIQRRQSRYRVDQNDKIQRVHTTENPYGSYPHSPSFLNHEQYLTQNSIENSSSGMIDIGKLIIDETDQNIDQDSSQMDPQMKSFHNAAKLREGKLFAKINSELRIYDIAKLGCNIDVASEILAIEDQQLLPMN